MNLWIRSQDKEDLVNNPLRIYYDCNYEGVHKVVANTYDETIYLGTYKTKERALEILNEIQNILNPLIIFKNCEITKEELDNAIKEHAIMINGDSSSVEQLNVCVYEMPKE